MRAFVIGVAALAFGATLSACSSDKNAALEPVKTDPAAVEKLVTELTTETFKGKATAAADVAAVRDALPQAVALTWGGLNFDQASGATVLTAVKLTPADMPTVGLSVDEVRLWDFNTDFAKARLAGQRLTETASLASRIELKGAKVFGLETLMGPAVEAATDAVEGAATPAAEEFDVSEFQPKLESYDISIGRLIIDDFVLRPYEMTPATLEPGSDFAEMMPVLQQFAAVSRTFASNASAAQDLKAAFAMTQMGQRIAFDMAAKTVGTRGSRGGDLDVSFIRGLSFAADIPGDQFSGTPGQKMAGSTERYTLENLRLDKVYSYLAKGQWPPRTEANLLSLGKFASYNTSMSLAGQPIYTSAEEVADLQNFHWFIPTKITLSAKDVSYNIGGLVNYVAAMDPSIAAQTTQVMDVLSRTGLEKLNYNSNFAWDWNAESGLAKIAGVFDGKEFLKIDATFEGSLPSFKAVSDLVPDNIDQTDGAAVGKVFEQASTLKLVNLDIVDNGGLNKSFVLATEIMKMQPATPDAPNPMANMTPEQLRSMASAGIYMVADQAASQVPSASALIKPLAAFIEKGGRVKITVAPKEPVQLATFGNAIASGQTSPDAAIQQLNIKVEHMPPAGK
ncbi:MAG TPA: hypothetical protein VFV70_03920 [Hyphomonadaceae bacterium]|nr:hypothetical protein [Hyphomonadaceae bacterium]